MKNNFVEDKFQNCEHFSFDSLIEELIVRDMNGFLFSLFSKQKRKNKKIFNYFCGSPKLKTFLGLKK